MFSLNESLHYYLYPYYINMGCGIEILSELVRNTKTGNPLSGDVYLFCGKKRDMTNCAAGRKTDLFYIRSV